MTYPLALTEYFGGVDGVIDDERRVGEQRHQYESLRGDDAMKSAILLAGREGEARPE